MRATIAENVLTPTYREREGRWRPPTGRQTADRIHVPSNNSRALWGEVAMELRRRELLKLGLFVSAALMLPAERWAGHVSYVTNPQEFKDYPYPNVQEARSLWYHDHGVHFTAPNAYMGLAAMYILHDKHELSLPIPHDRYDVPLVIKDALFTSS